nr:MAG TPA: hypothetical protein [Caudoviricetes sp.]
MPLKIKCTYVAEGEPFTLGEKYSIYCESATNRVYYIKNDLGFKLPYRHDEDGPVIDGLLDTLHTVHYSHFTPCITLNDEPEKDIKKEVYELLDKAVELLYNNQEVFNIKLDDFVTLVKIKEDLK